MKNRLFSPKLRRAIIPFVILSFFILIFSCRNETRQADDMQVQEDQTTVDTTEVEVETRTFRGDIQSVNTETNADTEVSGEIVLRVEGDLMRFTVSAEGLAPDMMHMQHLQTSETGGDTQCPGSDADANNDGVVDVTEISPSAQGVRMIPLHMGPSSMEMNVDTYPRSNVNGEIQFSRTVSLDSLKTAVRDEYGMQDVDFTRFTYVIQGVAEDSNIPKSAQTVTDVPMHHSIPVGCARLEEE